MTKPAFDKTYWEELWTRTLRDHGDKVDGRPPSAQLRTHVESLSPGRALDAGCGHGAEALWLAAQGWQVTAVDFSAAALEKGRTLAQALGAETARRLTWVEADLGTWAPEKEQYDLVFSLYVHVAGSMTSMVERLASGVAPGGTLFLVGHQPFDPETGAPTAAAQQTQISVDAVVQSLTPERWQLLIAEERRRSNALSGVDALVCARRTT